MKEINIKEITRLIEKLPSGSGFNYNWKTYIDRHGNIHCISAYDYMNENGFYDTVIQFEVVLKDEYKNDFDLHFINLSNHQKYIVQTQGLRQYFGDTIAYSFSD